eukprot:Pgem_evm1s13288
MFSTNNFIIKVITLCYFTSGYTSASPISNDTRDCPAQKEGLGTKLLQHWIDTLSQNSPQKQAALYSEQGYLLPTVSFPRENRSQIEEYFVGFLANKPSAVINTLVQEPDACDEVIISGIYTFNLNGNYIEARYSYIFEFDDNENWLIAQHHSSVQPHPDCPAQEYGLGRNLLQNWLDTLHQRSPEKQAALYSANGYLLPTVSNIPRKNRQEIYEYFVDFFRNKPTGKIETLVQVPKACYEVIISGLYTFDLNGIENRARYTFVFKQHTNKKHKKWLIAQHHSSAEP